MPESSSPQLVFLAGGTGFVGGYVARRLAERGHRVRALVRDRESRRTAVLKDIGADLVRGDITQAQTLASAAKGCDAVVNLVGIIRERPPRVTYEEVHTHGTTNLIKAAERSGVRRFLQMSALGADPDGTPYQRTKFEAEEAVRRADLSWVIMRPSVIVGRGGEFTRLLMRLIRVFPVTPVIGDGMYRMQPIAVSDVAEAFALAVEREDLMGGTYDIAGPHKLTYNKILEIVSEELGYRRGRFHIPLGPVRPAIQVASDWGLPTPITSEQLVMMLEENVASGEANVLREVFGLEPESLRAVIRDAKS